MKHACVNNSIVWWYIKHAKYNYNVLQSYITFCKLGTSIQSVLREKSFAEPKLVIYKADKECKAQGFVLAE